MAHLRDRNDMRILYIAPRIPFPPEEREAVRPYHHLRQIALRHDVDLVCFSGHGVDEAAARARLQNICHRVIIVPLDSSPQHPDSVLNFFTRRPLAFRRYFRKDLLRRLESIAESNRYDLIFVYSAAMVPYLAAFPGVPKVLDLVEVGSLRWLEQAKFARFPASTIFRAEAARLLKVELLGASRAHRVLFATEREARLFRKVLPQGEGIASLKTPVNPRAALRGSCSADPTVLFTGHLDHFPNRDAASFLMREIFPRARKLCRNIRLIIAGRNPPPDIRALAEKTGASLNPNARDLPRLFRDAWIMVAPHRIPFGVRNEILEALALGLPVLATPEAVMGLDLLPDRDLKVRTDAPRFAAEIAHLLDDSRKLDALGSKGRRAVHNNHSHWSTAIRLEELITEAALAGVGAAPP